MLERTVAWYKAWYEEGRLLSAEQLNDYTDVALTA
jgi:hypothetical protein